VRIAARALLIISIAVATLPLCGATAEWTGAGAPVTLWSDPANWIAGRVPAPGDDLLFPASRPTTSVNDLPAGIEYRSITIATVLNDRYTLSGNAIRLGTGGMRVSGAYDGGYTTAHTVALPITLTANQSWILSVDRFASLLVSGDVEVGAHTLTIENRGLYGPLRFTGRVSGTGRIASSHNNTWFYGPTDFHGTIISGSEDWLRLIGTTWGAAHIVHTAGRFQMNRNPTTGAFTATGGEWGGSGNMGNLVLEAGSVMRAGAAYESYTHGLPFERIRVTGSVTINGATLGLNGMGGAVVDMQNGGTVPKATVPGEEFVIIDNDGSDPVAGRFAPWAGVVWHGAVSGAQVHGIHHNVDFTVIYDGGDGNDVVVRALPAGADTTTTLQILPQPSSQWMTLTAAVAGGTSTPTGSVQFIRYEDDFFHPRAEVVGSALVGPDGVATLTLPRGNGTTYYASYLGDLGHRPSRSDLVDASAVTADVPALGTTALLAMLIALALAGAALLR
jgi:hypothetical protein